MPARDTTLDLFATAEAAAPEVAGTAPVPPSSQWPINRRARELWLAVTLPLLPLEALARGPVQTRPRTDTSATSIPSRPVVVVDADDAARSIVACNAHAARAGIAPGLGLNAAFALAQDLVVRARDPQQEQSWLERLASGALAFTPRVVLAAPDLLLLEVRGSLGLFGGVQSLGERLRRWLDGLGITSLLAMAPTPLAALWLARAEGDTSDWPTVMNSRELPGRLARLPIACLRWPERSCQDLQTMGVTTVGDCLRLPRDGFARRFGPSLLDELDRAVGRLPDVRRAHVPRERFIESLEFDHEIAEGPRLTRALEPLLVAMGEFLCRRQCCLRGFELQLQHRSLPATRVAVRLVAPAADAAHFIELMTTQLERMSLPASVHRVRLRSGVLLPIDAALLATGEEEGAFAVALRTADLAQGPSGRPAVGRRTAQLQVPRLVERLRARLGAAAVHGVCLVPEHRPESASKAAEPLAVYARSRRGRQASRSRDAQPSTRPLWLLSEPQQLAVERGWPCYEGRLVLEQGPERIESGWWDGADVARDYYIARSVGGLRLWIYRERRAGRHWFAHGVFA